MKKSDNFLYGSTLSEDKNREILFFSQKLDLLDLESQKIAVIREKSNIFLEILIDRGKPWNVWWATQSWTAN